jgi:hypothetical protein
MREYPILKDVKIGMHTGLHVKHAQAIESSAPPNMVSLGL